MNDNKNINNSRILIIDDNLTNIQILGTILRNQNYLVNVAQNGKEALKILKNTIPNLILLDVFMPEMNGFEVCQKIKENPQIKQIPIIFLTALNNNEAKIKGFEVGGVDYIVKPFDKLELLARVDTHLNLQFAHQLLKKNNEILIETNKEIKNKNVQLNEALKKLEILAKTDPLTNIYNRRFMYEKLEEQKNKFEKENLPFSVILADIDFFKDFNDVYGHLCGDSILKDLTAFIQKNIGENDYLARWGGEEFIIIVPNTDHMATYRLAEQLRKNIKNKTFFYNSTRLKITLTFGVSEFKKKYTIDDIIKDVDEAMYEGKRKGKNCVVIK